MSGGGYATSKVAPPIYATTTNRQGLEFGAYTTQAPDLRRLFSLASGDNWQDFVNWTLLFAAVFVTAIAAMIVDMVSDDPSSENIYLVCIALLSWFGWMFFYKLKRAWGGVTYYQGEMQRLKSDSSFSQDYIDQAADYISYDRFLLIGNAFFFFVALVWVVVSLGMITYFHSDLHVVGPAAQLAMTASIAFTVVVVRITRYWTNSIVDKDS